MLPSSTGETLNLIITNDKPSLGDIPNKVIIILARAHIEPVDSSSRRTIEPKLAYQYSRRARTSTRNQKGALMNIQERPGIPGIPESRVPVGSEQLEYATAGSGDGIGETNDTFSAAGGDNKSEKGLHLCYRS